jgi:hypothetical protein
MMRRARTAQRAQALIYLALALPMFLAMAGLAIDGALLVAARRELQSLVDGAARAGATRLDMDTLRASGGSTVQLDRPRAAAATNAYLEQRLAHDLPWVGEPARSVTVDVREVHVTVAGALRPAFLRIVGVESVAVDASSLARAQYGIREAAPR